MSTSDRTASFFTYNNDSSDAAHYKQTTQIAAGSSPAVSGDGSKILVENGGNIVVYDQQGHVLTTITPADAGVAGALWKPALSAERPRYRILGFGLGDAHGAGQLFSYNQSTGSITVDCKHRERSRLERGFDQR